MRVCLALRSLRSLCISFCVIAAKRAVEEHRCGLDKRRTSKTQTHRHTNTQTHKHTGRHRHKHTETHAQPQTVTHQHTVWCFLGWAKARVLLVLLKQALNSREGMCFFANCSRKLTHLICKAKQFVMLGGRQTRHGHTHTHTRTHTDTHRHTHTHRQTHTHTQRLWWD